MKVKILEEEERQCGVGGERFREGFSEAAIGEADKWSCEEWKKEIKGKGSDNQDINNARERWGRTDKLLDIQ